MRCWREEASMTETTMSKALVFTLLRHAEDFAWRKQDIGLRGLRLEYRLRIFGTRRARRSNRWPRRLWSGSRTAALPP
jgi:hypothetical protein